MKDGEESLSSQLPQLELFVTNEIISQCVSNLKAVNDIPRLYRRTNRDVSTRPLFYYAVCWHVIALNIFVCLCHRSAIIPEALFTCRCMCGGVFISHRF